MQIKRKVKTEIDSEVEEGEESEQELPMTFWETRSAKKRGVQ